MSLNEFSPRHPHEPETPPIFDAEGRCLICCRLVLEAEVARLRAENEKLASEAQQWSERFAAELVRNRRLREAYDKAYEFIDRVRDEHLIDWRWELTDHVRDELLALLATSDAVLAAHEKETHDDRR